jgi:iron-sulfur cluster assembly accessory protein
LDTTATETKPAAVNLTPAAAKKVGELLEQEGNPEYFLRVAVQPGGCSGLRYSLYFDDRKLDDDVASEIHGVTVRVDRMSAPYLRGARIDWVESLQESGFAIDNPNAHGTCACGDSFH